MLGPFTPAMGSDPCALFVSGSTNPARVTGPGDAGRAAFCGSRRDSRASRRALSTIDAAAPAGNAIADRSHGQLAFTRAHSIAFAK
jgi:hypothetical protein